MKINVLNYKNPKFWVITAAIILVTVIGVEGMANSQKSNETLSLNTRDDMIKINKLIGGTVYELPPKLQKESYNVEDFKNILSRIDDFVRANNLDLQISPEYNLKIIYEGNVKHYPIDFDEITPQNVKEETGCQIFKAHQFTFLVYNSKVYEFDNPVYGFGAVDFKTCDFDGNGKKELIYTFDSSGSGIAHNYVALLDLTNMNQEKLFEPWGNLRLMLEKISDSNFKIYTADLTSREEQDFVHFKLAKQKHVADINCNYGKIKINEIP